MVDAKKIKIVEEGKESTFEEGKDKIESVEFDVIDKILTIAFEKDSEFDRKIIFLDNVVSIEYKETNKLSFYTELNEYTPYNLFMMSQNDIKIVICNLPTTSYESI